MDNQGGAGALRRPSAAELAAILDAHAAWRSGQGGTPADLRGLDLNGLSLRGRDLQGANLQGASAAGADLRNAKLRKLDLKGVDFSRADLTGASFYKADLRGACLVDARLRRADLVAADLREADLSGANLMAADLGRADLAEARLRRANFRDASLQDADLHGCRGLLVGQIGGSNCAGARLPEDIARFEGLTNVAEASKSTQNLFTSVLLVCAYAWLTIASTTDAQLLNNAAPPSSRLPILGTDIPLVRFYAAAPLLLLCLYVYFHLGLQRLWEELAELPAVFPDGRPLDKKAYPWLMNVLIRAYAARLKESRSHLARWQARISVLLAWGLVPLTLVLLWARYLRAHEWLVTALHVALLAAGVGAGAGFLRLASSTLQGSEKRAFLWRRAWRDARTSCLLTTLGLIALFGLLSYGAIEGSNPEVAARKIDVPRPAGLALLDPRHWVPRAFAFSGFSPFAHLDDVHLSTAPPNWTVRRDDDESKPRDDQAGPPKPDNLDTVKGADLERRNLRYATAYNVFLVNAYLRFSDLERSDLRDADLRKADLRDTNLVGANLRDADLREADLKRSQMAGAKLKDARGTWANLGGVDLTGADLSGADLRAARFDPPPGVGPTKLVAADLRGADLAGADLRLADLRNARLDSPPDAPADRPAVGANLRGADLRGARLDGANLAAADLSQADLRGADLTAAVGLTDTQLQAAITDPSTRLPAPPQALARVRNPRR